MRKAILTLLLLAAGAEFAMRGPRRALTESGDFAAPYLAARAWLGGTNPYDHDQLDRLWPGGGGAPKERPVKQNTPSVYPPTAFVILAPLAVLPWPRARAALLGVNLVLVGLMLGALVATLGWDWRDWRAGLFVGLALALAPLHTGLAQGNLIVPVAALIVIAIRAAAKGQEALAGLLIAAAAGLKPQVGGILALYYALGRRWRVCGVAAAASVLLAAVAVGRLETHGVDWERAWMRNTAESSATGGTNDATRANPSRHHLINLQWPLHEMFDRSWVVTLLVSAIVGGLLAVCLLAGRPPETGSDELLAVGALAVISLLPVYHRAYDAVLLVIPLAWGLSALDGPLKREASLALLLMLPFLIPGPVILRQLIARDDRWWNTLVLAHQVWALALLAACLVYARAKAGTRHRTL